MTLPKTVLSFLYHEMISPYRDEMHVDFDTAFARFNVTDPSFQTLCRDADKAAFDLRSSPSSPQAQAGLAASSKLIFGALAPVLAQEVAQGVTAPPQPLEGSGLVDGALPEVYRLFYSAAFRATNPPAPDPSVQAAWDAFKGALTVGGGAVNELLAPATALCNLMMDEATQGTWLMWW
jgi:hypothetical protein